jgi:hypothetical protein
LALRSAFLLSGERDIWFTFAAEIKREGHSSEHDEIFGVYLAKISKD